MESSFLHEKKVTQIPAAAKHLKLGVQGMLTCSCCLQERAFAFFDNSGDGYLVRRISALPPTPLLVDCCLTLWLDAYVLLRSEASCWRC
jgi:hypothetical protein